MLQALDIVGNKWSVPILYFLQQAGGNLRFRELLRRLAPVSQKELTRHLRRLQRTGLVSRHVLGGVPPKVDYALTPLGRGLIVPLERLACWAEENAAQIAASEEAFDRAAAG